jgi:hypothetical protein
MRKQVADWLLRRGTEAALKTASEVVPKIAQDEYHHVFEVLPPVTVYIYASHARVTVRRATEPQVRLDADLRGAFGWQLVTDQDDAGVYIVAKRKPVVGALSSAAFTLSVPAETRLLVELTPGALLLEDLDGKLDISAVSQRVSSAALPRSSQPTRR